jgi:hypothetical protein
MDYPVEADQMSDADLLAYSKEHLRYEVQNFFDAGRLLATRPFDTSDSNEITIKNALVESFATHLRNLLLFLYPYGGEKSDVISDLFFSNPILDWKQKRRPESVFGFRDLRQRASQEVSHLTVFRRSADKDKQWQLLDIMQSVKAVLDVFVENAAPTKLDASVKDLVKSIQPPASPLRIATGSTSAIAITVVGSSTATNQPSGVNLTITSKPGQP